MQIAEEHTSKEGLSAQRQECNIIHLLLSPLVRRGGGGGNPKENTNVKTPQTWYKVIFHGFKAQNMIFEWSIGQNDLFCLFFHNILWPTGPMEE